MTANHNDYEAAARAIEDELNSLPRAKTMRGEIILTAEPRGGDDLEVFAARLVYIAWMTGWLAMGCFNGMWLIARPGMTRKEVAEPYDAMLRRSYFGEGEGT